MLTLRRYEGEAIRIGGEVTVRIVRVRRMDGAPQVELQIAAPPDVVILREELIGTQPRERREPCAAEIRQQLRQDARKDAAA